MNKFLELTKKNLGNLRNYEKIHVFLGNESCDLDSAISSLVYAYFFYQHQYLDTRRTIAVPVLNINYDEFPLRTETKYFLNKHNISHANLIFRNLIDLGTLYDENKLLLTLVDHHVLPEKDKRLSNKIFEVIDHRPIEKDASFDTEYVYIKPVGSCCTLITQKIIEINSQILNCELARLLHGTIVLDTVNFNHEAKRFTELDIKTVEYLEENYTIQRTRSEIYNELIEARSDVSSLTPFQILHRDMKIVCNIPVPGVPMLFSEFLNILNADEALEEFKSEFNSEVVIPMGLVTVDDMVYRDIGVYGKDCTLKEKLIRALKESELDLSDEETPVEDLSLFKQNNVKMSRKHIIPIIAPVIKNCK